MCKFFSFISNGKGKFFYFNDVERRKLLRTNPDCYNPDSYTSIIHKFINKNLLIKDKYNKYEYSNGFLKVNQINTTDDSIQAKVWIESFSKTKKFQKICLEAVRQNIWFINSLTEDQKTPEICLTVVKQNGDAIQFLTESQRTPEVCLAAVKQNGCAVKYLTEKQRTLEICLAAVKQNGDAIQFLTESQRTPEVCLAAVKQNDNAIKYLTKKEREYINDFLFKIPTNLFLISEIKEIENLLAIIPENNVIERMSLKSRLESIKTTLTQIISANGMSQ